MRRKLRQILQAGVMFAISFGAPHFSWAQPPTVWERAFSYNDIYHFVGHPFESADFQNIKSIEQTFQCECDHLNRIILSFYLKPKRKGQLKFELFSSEDGGHALFSKMISVQNLSDPKKIGTHNLSGTLYQIWTSPLKRSKGKTYSWKLSSDPESAAAGVGVFLTTKNNSQLRPARVGAAVQDHTYAAFYSYCKYEMDVDRILGTAASRLGREPVFLTGYFFLMTGVGVFAWKENKKG